MAYTDGPAGHQDRKMEKFRATPVFPVVDTRVFAYLVDLL